MSAAAARKPTEAELKAHQRHIAFHESIAEKAAALQAGKQRTPQKAVSLQTAQPAEVLAPQFPALSFPPMKKPWFSIVGVAAPPPLRVREIQDVVCEAYGFDLVELTSQRRTARVVLARQVAMYLARVMTGRSLPDIARRFGGRDHTTVIHAFRKIGAKVKFNPERPDLFDAELADLVKALRTEIEARRG